MATTLVFLTVTCVLLIATGAALMYPPAGLITAGALGLGLVYAAAYLAARKAGGS